MAESARCAAHDQYEATCVYCRWQKAAAELDSRRRVQTLADFEQRVFHSEGPLAAALDRLYGEGNWDEQEADALGDAFMAAMERAREDRQAELQDGGER